MKDIWELAISDLKQHIHDQKLATERTLVLCGDKNVGKTSLVNSFLNKDDAIKPTTAIEYSFGFISKGHEKEVGHVYELGGGTWLAKMLGSIINSSNVSNAVFAIMVDLSSPSNLWRVLEHLVSAGKSACEAASASLDQQQQAKLQEELTIRFPEDHPDNAIKGLLKPFPIPLVIIGGKYDQFQAMEPEPRKQVCRGLRFFAHTYGATLLFYSQRNEQLVARVASVLSNVLFGTELPVRSPIFEANKPLYVPVGADNFSDIGMPPTSESVSVRSRASDPVTFWRESLAAVFPVDNDEQNQKSSLFTNPISDPQFAEAVIDQMRKQKDVELERYRRQSERRAREVATLGSEMQDIYD